MSSDALLERAKTGEARAWNELYRWLAPAVAGYLGLRGAHDVDDLTSETFVAVFRNIATFDGSIDQFRSWVFVIAHRRLLDARRSLARRPVMGPVVDDVATEQDFDGALDAARVRALCAQLPTEQADVLVLRILGDFTIEQIAEVVGKSAGAVKQLQRRGLENLRKISSAQAVPPRTPSTITRVRCLRSSSRSQRECAPRPPGSPTLRRTSPTSSLTASLPPIRRGAL